MRAFIANSAKRLFYPYHPKQRWAIKPLANRGKYGKQRAVEKWRSRKAKRRADKVALHEQATPALAR